LGVDFDAGEADAAGEGGDVALPEVVHVEEEGEEWGVAAAEVRGEVEEDQLGEAQGEAQGVAVAGGVVGEAGGASGLRGRGARVRG
jgi:hypothetical protein